MHSIKMIREKYIGLGLCPEARVAWSAVLDARDL